MTNIILAVNNGIVTTTSNEVAVNFGKRHDTVLRSIDNLECSPEFHLRNFAEVFREVDAGNGAKVNYRAFTLTALLLCPSCSIPVRALVRLQPLLSRRSFGGHRRIRKKSYAKTFHCCVATETAHPQPSGFAARRNHRSD
jgi:hypothetical protein